jgi:hypothetical protein
LGHFADLRTSYWWSVRKLMRSQKLLSNEDLEILTWNKEVRGDWNLTKTSAYMDSLTEWIEEILPPDQVAHLSFPQPIGQAKAQKLLYRFFQEICRNTKQHIHYWAWSDIQPNRSGVYEHFHCLLNYELRTLSPLAIETLWCGFVQGTKESARVTEYEQDGNIIGYCASKHSRWLETFVCSGGQHRCRNGRDCWWNRHPSKLQTFKLK